MLLIKKLNVVDCNVVRYNNKTYRVDDFDWDKRFDYFFKFRNDIIIIIVEYYKKVSCGVISFILFFLFYYSLERRLGWFKYDYFVIY